MDIVTYVHNLRNMKSEQKLKKQLKVEETKTLPFVYSIFSIAMSSGLSVEHALRVVCDFSPSVYKSPIERTLKEMDLGKSFPSSSHHMQDNESLRPLTHVMLETYDLGNDSMWVIDALNKDALNKIKRESEIAIKRLPITMLLPLVVCILPAFIFLSILPTLINGFFSIDW